MLSCAVTAEMLQAGYWIDRSETPDTIMMNQAEINAYNQAIYHNLPHTCYDLTAFPEQVERSILAGWLTAAAFPDEPLYRNGQLITPAYYTALQANLNLKALTAQNQVQYALTINRTNLRTFPTADLILAEPDRTEFDSFQETGLNPGEPVLILHQNPATDWSYIQTGNYRGWTPTVALAVAASRQQWLDYLQPAAFLVVTDKNLTISGPGITAPYYFEMGARISLAEAVKPTDALYTALLPSSDPQNRLQTRPVPVPISANIHLGYLNYNRAHLFRQAFKFCGQPYDWGGLHGGVDCSGLILNLFRCFGFAMPRNAGEQAQLPGQRLDLRSLTPKQKKAALGNLSPGATLYMKGHVMLYLGTVNDTPYILHALSSYGIPEGPGQIRKNYHLQVSVTDLSLLRASGQSFLEALTGAVELL